MIGIEEEQLDAAFRSLHRRYSGKDFTWSVSQKGGSYTCTIDRAGRVIADGPLVKSSSTKLACAIENAVIMANQRFRIA